jgi:hypothetical protein
LAPEAPRRSAISRDLLPLAATDLACSQEKWPENPAIFDNNFTEAALICSPEAMRQSSR